MQVGQGAGYVYMHQGCCEHLLELRDVRTVQKADPKPASMFPVTLFQAGLHSAMIIVHRQSKYHWQMFQAMLFCIFVFHRWKHADCRWFYTLIFEIRCAMLCVNGVCSARSGSCSKYWTCYCDHCILDQQTEIMLIHAGEEV